MYRFSPGGGRNNTTITSLADQMRDQLIKFFCVKFAVIKPRQIRMNGGFNPARDIAVPIREFPVVARVSPLFHSASGSSAGRLAGICGIDLPHARHGLALESTRPPQAPGRSMLVPGVVPRRAKIKTPVVGKSAIFPSHGNEHTATPGSPSHNIGFKDPLAFGRGIRPVSNCMRTLLP